MLPGANGKRLNADYVERFGSCRRILSSVGSRGIGESQWERT